VGTANDKLMKVSESFKAPKNKINYSLRKELCNKLHLSLSNVLYFVNKNLSELRLNKSCVICKKEVAPALQKIRNATGSYRNNKNSRIVRCITKIN